MTFYQQTRRLMGLRVYFIIGTVVLGMVMASVGDDIMQLFISTCDEPPAYHDDVPQDVRDQIDELHEQGLLYCSDPIVGLRDMEDRVYWATDGVSSLLFFQANDLSDLGVVRYGFGQKASSAFVPVTTGAAPILGVREDIVGRAAITNQAPEGSSYFYRIQGAPADDDIVATVTIRGTARAQPGVTRRDAFRDIEMAWNRLSGATVQEIGDTSPEVTIPLLSGMWDKVARRNVTPDLANEDGRVSAGALRDAAFTEPMVLQTVSGLLGTTVWVAGVVSGTNPSLVLAPVDESDGVQIEPIAQSSWIVAISDNRLEHFAFEPLPAGASYDAQYWHESRDRGTKPPDYTWPVTVP